MYDTYCTELLLLLQPLGKLDVCVRCLVLDVAATDACESIQLYMTYISADAHIRTKNCTHSPAAGYIR